MKKRLFCILAALAVLSGCSVIDELPTNPETIIKEPLGPKVVKVGMTKDEVLSLYGDPDYKDFVKSEEWEKEREEWFYKSAFGRLPVSSDYFGEDLYLYFDGDRLTNVSANPIGRKRSEPPAENAENNIK